MLKQYGKSTNEIDQEDVLKVPVLNRSMKGTMISVETEQKWNA